MDIYGAVLRETDADLSIEPLRLRDAGDGELLVEVVATGMCHTDLLPRTPGFLAAPPVVLGHEGAGIVRAVGTGVTGFAPGDHVLMSYAACGDCRNCRRDEPYGCYRFFRANMTGHTLDGTTGPMTDAAGAAVASSWFGQSSFASHTVVDAANAVRVAADLPLDVLAPLGCGLQTGAGAVLNVVRPEPGLSIAVIGVGAVGLAATMAARAESADVIVAVDRQASRLATATRVGATTTIATGPDTDLRRELRGLVRGGLDAVIDTTGNPEVIEAAIEAIRPGGRVALVGHSSGPVTIAPGALAMGKSLIGVIEGSAVPQTFLPELIGLWQAGRFPIEQLITTYPLTDVARAERDLRAGRVIKPVLLPGNPPRAETLTPKPW